MGSFPTVNSFFYVIAGPSHDVQSTPSIDPSRKTKILALLATLYDARPRFRVTLALSCNQGLRFSRIGFLFLRFAQSRAGSKLGSFRQILRPNSNLPLLRDGPAADARNRLELIVTPIAETELQTQTQAARQALDAWTREIVQWHFNPETGCPFWLQYASKLDWDPRKEIQCYADLDRFGFFQDEWLRGGPVRRWVPKAYANRPIYTFETGGSTGVPKSRINVDDFRIDYEAYSETLPDEFFPKGADWISVGPSGPRRLRLAVEHLAQHRGGICFMTDLDPRWVIKCLKRGKPEEAEAYKQHVVEQALTLLRAHDIRCMFTTPSCSKPSAKRFR
jgi:hypothetical protein